MIYFQVNRKIYLDPDLREVDREWALVMNHQISLPLTI